MVKKKEINRYDTERLNAVPITSVARWLGEVKKKGTQYVTLCPWHEDKNPSLVLYERTNENHCYCFSCKGGGSVIDFVMKHQNVDFRQACEMLSNEFGIGTAATNANAVSRKPVVRKVPDRTVTYIPEDYVQQTLSSDSSFCKCLFQLYDKYHVETVAEQYRLGCFDNDWITGGTVFWSIDRKGRVHNGKVQCYCSDISSPQFAHYDKSPGMIMWLGNLLVKDGTLPADAEFDNRCLFGEHLLAEDPEAIVVLVESPKNAILGALEKPELLWVATGNKTMLKPDVLKPLKGRDVIVIPDRDAITEWRETIAGMEHIANFKVLDFCEKSAPKGDEKYDIADYIIGQRLPKQSF